MKQFGKAGIGTERIKFDKEPGIERHGMSAIRLVQQLNALIAFA